MKHDYYSEKECTIATYNRNEPHKNNVRWKLSGKKKLCCKISFTASKNFFTKLNWCLEIHASQWKC